MEEITDVLDSLSNIIGKEELRMAVEQYLELNDNSIEGEPEIPESRRPKPDNHQENMDVSIPDRAFIESFANAKWYKVNEELLGQGYKPIKRWAHTAVTIGENMYIYGGCGDKSLNFKEVMQFSYTNCQWSVLKSTDQHNPIYPPSRDSHVSFGYKNKLYIFGGTSSNIRLNDLWEFDIEKRKWREVHTTGEIPPPRDAHAATMIDNSAIIFGGKSSTEKLSDVHILNIEYKEIDSEPILSWGMCIQMGNAPCARDGHSMCTIGNAIYLFGGENNEKLMLNDLYQATLNCAAGSTHVLSWKKCEAKNGRIPRPRRACSISPYQNEYLIIIGGEAYDEAATSTLNDVWIYNIALEIWEEVFSLPRAETGDYFAPRGYHSCATYEENIYIFGGISYTGTLFDDLMILSLSGEPPKIIENSRTIAPSIVSGKDGRALMNTTKRVQYFTQYIQDTPFPTGEKITEESKAIKRSLEDLNKDQKIVANVGISPDFYCEMNKNGEWPLIAFGEIYEEIRELIREVKEYRIEILTIDKKEEQKIKQITEKSNEKMEDLQKLENASEVEILSQFTKKMQQDLKIQDLSRLENAINLRFSGNHTIQFDNFKDILYFFGKHIDQKSDTDFGKLKQALFKLGQNIFVINKKDLGIDIGLISVEYMKIIHASTYYCPYMHFQVENGKIVNNSSNMTLLDKMLKCSGLPFENKVQLFDFIQEEYNKGLGINFVITRIERTKKMNKKVLSLVKNKDIYYMENNDSIIDFSAMNSLKFYNFEHEIPFIFENSTVTENPYYKLAKFIEDKNLLSKWIIKIDTNLLDKNTTGLIFHINLFNEPEFKSYQIPYNGILLYSQNILRKRLLGPDLGNYLDIKRKLKKANLFDWNGYIELSKFASEDWVDPIFISSLEEKLENICSNIAN